MNASPAFGRSPTPSREVKGHVWIDAHLRRVHFEPGGNAYVGSAARGDTAPPEKIAQR